MEAAEPKIRIRISHAHTLKDGWRCDSTTVEWEGSGEVDYSAIQTHLQESFAIAKEEALNRNEMEKA